MYCYFIISIFLVFGYSIEYPVEDLKQAKVVEFISTKTINYIDNLKSNGDDKYYHFQKQLDAYLERSKARVVLNNIDGAHSDLDQILMKNPEYWIAYYYKGKIYTSLLDYSSALPYLEIAVEKDIGFDDLLLLRGIARFEENVKDLGLEDFEKLLKSNTLSQSDRFKALFYYSKILFISGDLENSLSAAIDAYEIDDENIGLLEHKGNIYRLLNMPKLAIVDFNKALSLGYNNRELYLYRGLSYIQLNEHSNAELDLARYLSLAQKSDSNRPQALLEFATVKFYLEDMDEALSNLDEVISLIPLELSAYAYRGIIHYKKESYQKAIDDFNIGIKSGLFHPDIYLYRGNAKFYLGQYESALIDFNTYLSMNPKQEESLYDVYINRAIIFYSLEYYEDALKDLNQSLEIKETGEAYVHRANVNRYLDRIDDCMDDLNKSLEFGETHIDIYLSRGLIHFYNQNYELAEKDLDLFLSNHQGFHKDELQAVLKRGIARYHLSKFELALLDFNELLFRDPSIIEGYRYRAEIYLMNDKKQLAKRDLNQALLSSETIPEIYLLKGIVELSLSNFNSSIININEFINLTSSGHVSYYQAFHERGMAEFFNENLVDACIDWNYAAENGYVKSIQLIQKNCNIYSKSFE